MRLCSITLRVLEMELVLRNVGCANLKSHVRDYFFGGGKPVFFRVPLSVMAVKSLMEDT